MPHSILAPSSAKEWVYCPGSVLMSAQCEDLSTKAEADEGTAVHAGIMEAIHKESKIPTGEPTYNVDEVKAEYTDEENECIDLAVDHVFQTVQEYGVANVHCEDQVNIHPIHEKAFGTPDMWGYSPPRENSQKAIIHLWDYKHGHGDVEAFENWQCLMYAIGIFKSLQCDEQTKISLLIKIYIIQPRSFHKDGPIRTWTITALELNGYFAKLKQAANTALGPNPPTLPGNHCRHCRGRRACPAIESYCMAAVDYQAGALAQHLDPHSLGLELQMLEDVAAAIKYRITGLTEQAEHHLRQGHQVPGYVMELGRGNLDWIGDMEDVFKAGDELGIDLRKPGAFTPTQAKKMGIPEDVIDAISHRPRKKNKLKRQTQADVRRIFQGANK